VEVDFAKEADKITAGYSRDSGNLIPILQEAQEEFGYLPETAMRKFAKFLKLPESTVFGVSTFYAQFKLTPTGRKKVVVCRGTACHVRGGETTEDMEYSLETVACIGACALAPTMRIGKETYGQMTTKKVAEVIGAQESR
jgi:NADH-quinone oxidoreductase subunit E